MKYILALQAKKKKEKSGRIVYCPFLCSQNITHIQDEGSLFEQ